MVELGDRWRNDREIYSSGEREAVLDLMVGLAGKSSLSGESSVCMMGSLKKTEGTGMIMRNRNVGVSQWGYCKVWEVGELVWE